MACGTQVVPGYKEFNAKMKQHGGKDPALEMKLDQMMTKGFDMIQPKKPPLYPVSNLPPQRSKTRRKSVDRMTREELVSNLESMELPETDSADFDSSEIRDILLEQAPDMFMSSRQI